MVAVARSRRPSPQREDLPPFAADVIEGLSATPKRIPAKYFYDQRGSDLFERITEQPEYYPTRCEMEVLRDKATEIAALIPENAAVVEFGSGSNKKARLLLAAAPHITAYVPVDISAEMLEAEAAELRADFPGLTVLPVAADFCYPFDLPEAARNAPLRVGFFPGSTIGNFEPHEAAAFLRNAGKMLGTGAKIIIGADLVKPVEILNAAYNDAAGVTAEFNMNLLVRMNRELGADFRLPYFRHRVRLDRPRRNVEMHIESLREQTVRFGAGGFVVAFGAGETIHTENSHKYTIPELDELAHGSGFRLVRRWRDAEWAFSSALYEAD